MTWRRRDLLASMVGAATTLGVPRFASAQRGAAQTLVGVTWGGPWLEGVKPIAAAWEKTHPNMRVAWELHEGSSAAVATKVRATWPNVKYDLIDGNDPVVHIMAREGWLESVDDLPNLKQVPDKFILRNDKGQATAVPHFAGGVTWGYRADLVDKPFTSLEELLEPRFRGKIGLRSLSSWSGLPLVSMARERGGDERNVEPGFAFLKDLAKSGNVVTVANSNTDVINSLNLGETAVFLGNSSEWGRVAANHPVKLVNRVSGSRSLRTYYTLAHWLIPKAPKSDLAKDFANLTLEAGNNGAFAKAISAAPVNMKAAVEDPVGTFLKPEELDQHAYFCDFKFMSENDQKWLERFDTEIRPLLRRG